MQNDSRPEWKKHNDEAEQVHEHSFQQEIERYTFTPAMALTWVIPGQTGEWLIPLLKISTFLKTPEIQK